MKCRGAIQTDVEKSAGTPSPAPSPVGEGLARFQVKIECLAPFPSGEGWGGGV
jgi:hypothetical protein